MPFNQNISKQAQDIIFKRKIKLHPDPVQIFRNSSVSKTLLPKSLELILGGILNCEEHLKQKITQAHKGIGASKKKRSLTINKSLLLLGKQIYSISSSSSIKLF